MKTKNRSFHARILTALILFAVLLIPYTTTLAAEASASAAPALDYTGLGDGFSAVLYDNSNGLPTSEANAVVQTEEGILWIGCYSGLIRYDGNEFYRYSTQAGIASVMSLFVDSRGRLWIGTNDSGIALLSDDAFSFYGKNDGLPSTSVRTITEDGDGNIVVGTTKGLAYIDKNGVLQKIDDPRINEKYVCELAPGSNGVLYGVTNDGDFFTLNGVRFGELFVSETIFHCKINTVYPDPDHPGFVYLGETGGSRIFYGDVSGIAADFSSLSASYGEDQENDYDLTTVNAIRKIGFGDGDYIVWIAADNGIGYFDSANRYVRLLNLPMDNSIDHIMQDGEGNLWFTSSRQGIMKIVGNRFTNIAARAKVDLPVVNSTCLVGSDLYLATDKGLWIIDENYEIKENAATAELRDVRIRCAKKDEAGRVWLCTYDKVHGLVCYDPSSDAILFNMDHDTGGLASNSVRMLTFLSDGTIAVATNGGVNLVSGNAVVSTFGREQGLSNLEILCIEEGKDGELYFGSDGDGIYRSSGGSVSRIGSEDGLLSEVILRLKRDPVDEDLIWVVTSNSLAYLKNGKVTTLNEFPYSNNFDLFFDQADNVWVLSSNGIYVCKRDDLLSGERFSYTHYDKESGLPGIATANSYSALSADGTLYVAATTGVYSVNINRHDDDAANVPLSIPYLSVDGKNVWLHGEEKVHIPSNCKRLNIYANAFTYSLNNPHLSYCLEGFDSAPVYLTKQEMKSATYTNLKGGTYRFTISLINEDTGEPQKTVSILIVKDRAFYETVWFFVLVGLAALLLLVLAGWFFYRKKTAAFRKRQKANRELINQMTRVFSGCVDMKDAYTNGHSSRVADYSAMFARELGKSEEEVERIRNIALLHDVGKISIPDNILNKPGKLDNDEFAVMKTHSSRGFEILKAIAIDPDIALGAGYHHEKFDGTGYPSGLKGDEIPEVAQIIAVADAFDAMYSTRPYRTKMPLEKVVAEIKRCTGTQFSPRVVEAFLHLVDAGAFNDEAAAFSADRKAR